MHPVLYIIIMIIIGVYLIKNANKTVPSKFTWGTFTKRELEPFFDEFKRVMTPYVSFDFSHYISGHVHKTLEECRYRYKEGFTATDRYNEFYKFAIESTDYYGKRLVVALLIYQSPNGFDRSMLRPREEEREAYNQMLLAVTKTLIQLIDDIPPITFEYLGISSDKIQKDYEEAISALKLRSYK